MAQQKGIIPLKGTIGNITFYKSGDGYLAREKGLLASQPYGREEDKRRRARESLLY